MPNDLPNNSVPQVRVGIAISSDIIIFYGKKFTVFSPLITF